MTTVLVATGLALAACSTGTAAGGSTLEKPVTQLFDAGLSAISQARYPQAIADFGAVLQLQPRNYFAAYDLGVASTDSGKTAAAVSAYRRSLSIKPTFRSAMYNLALLYENPAPAKAILLFREIEQIDPKDPNVEFNFGLTLEHAGEISAGETQLAAALKAEPSLRKLLPKGTKLPQGT
jgi:tetratricopeptide (TPR) repeat protein